jgi:hypothetical protein
MRSSDPATFERCTMRMHEMLLDEVDEDYEEDDYDEEQEEDDDKNSDEEEEDEGGWEV